MADADPVLTIRRGFKRPAPQVVAAFAAAPTGNIADARGRRGALDHRIRPLTRQPRFAGPALTVQSRARDNLAPWAALPEVRPGDVIVIAIDGYAEASVIGDVYAGMAKNGGAAAIVTDGMIRDLDEIDAMGLVVAAQGLTPNSPFKDGPGSVGLRVTLGGAAVESGDIVVGDRDGVVVVPQAEIDLVLKALETIKEKEIAMAAEVKGGARSPGWLPAALRTKGVRYLD